MSEKQKKALKAAFPHTVPILTGFLFLGFAYGVYMHSAGLSFPKTGWKRFYLIFGMCDETFSINYSAEIPEDTDPEWFMFFVTLFNQSYWVIGSCIGTLLGNVLPFSTEGIDFVMTALFAVIFMDQFLKEKNHFSSFLGLSVSILSLLVFKEKNFILPAMLGITAILLLVRPQLKKQLVKSSET